jgi:poly-gamma-glutamate capsule biosynthesis protein CapA/YwtB (metallophosphatase superfamily)
VLVAVSAIAGTLGYSSAATGSAVSHSTDLPHHTVASSRQTAAAPPVKLSAVGDMIFGNTPTLPSHPKHYLDDVAPAIAGRANIVFANLEGTLTTQTAGKCGRPNGGDCFNFRNPPHYAKYFAADGFTVLNNANNHSHDFGQAGLDQTVRAIKAVGLKQTGLPGQITVVHVGDRRVALVGFAPYSNTADMLRLKSAAALIRKARAKARVVIVYMHAGAEGSDRQHVTGGEEFYVGEDRGNPEKFAHRAIRNGASLVIASGPHVLRGMQFYRGRLIAYSLGNFANFHNFGGGGVLSDSAILHVRLSASGRFESGRLIPVVLDGEGHPTIGGPSIKVVRSLSKQDFGASAPLIGRRGVIRQPGVGR